MWRRNKRRRFGIRRYFAIASAVVILPAMALVWVLFQQHAIEGLIEVEEGHNVALTNVLSKTVWTRFSAYLTSVSGSTGDDVTAGPETQEIDELLRELVEGLSIVKITIFGTEGVMIYSSELSEIGGGDHHTGFLDAKREGKPQSVFWRDHQITAFSGETLYGDVVETYVPIKETYVPITNRTGDFLGVFEVYSDVTDLKEGIDNAIFNIIVSLFLIFTLLYGALVFVVMRRATAPLHLASDRALAIGPRSSGVRLPIEGMPQEVFPLIEAMNGALDRLDRALDAQHQFTADAAHELLAPLAVLTAHLDSIEDKKFAAEIRTDVEAMSDLVTRLLALAELDVLDTAESEVVDVRETCLEVISTMAPIAYAQSKTLSLTGSEKALKVRCSSDMLSRVVRNLVENAIVHTPANTSVEVNLEDDGAIRVIDNGPGVAAADRSHIFQRFWRGRKKNRPGAGLGLSIVKRIVDAYGGAVEVSDAAGGGATFTIRLPTVEDR
jgi:signal transduction histidine kinase